MCRIAGIHQPQHPNLPAAIQRMCDALQHGGPDDAGGYLDDQYPLALGHRRLAIIDLSAAGHQPMADHPHGLQITFNGEIYNYKALRTELIEAGYTFQSQSDTEVLLKAYAHWGTDSFERLNGMFAFALLDQRRNELLLVRDHAGIKPLYYHQHHTTLVFASEIRAFRAYDPNWAERADWRTYFLTFGHLPEPVTTLQGVQPLPAGHYYRYDLRAQTGQAYRYTQEEYQPTLHDRSAAIAAVRKTLQESMHRQLVADVPVGLFLSGGLDSSVLTLAAKAELGDRLRTTSIIFDEPAYTEKAYQDLVIEASGARNEAHTLTSAEFELDFEDIMAAMDQPTNDGINSYFVCKYARQSGLTVALSGLGADELLGGYPSFQYARYLPYLRSLAPLVLRQMQGMEADRWRKIAFLSLPGAVGEYLFYRGMHLPATTARLTGQNEAAVWKTLEDFAADCANPALTGGNRVSWIEQHFYMRNQLLKDTDAMSMWHSLEVRVPYLDKEFLRCIRSIAPNVKFHGAHPKELLIQAFYQELPRGVWDRPKKGFTFPFAEWFRHSERLRAAPPQFAALREQFLQKRLSWARLWVAYLAMQPLAVAAGPPVF